MTVKNVEENFVQKLKVAVKKRNLVFFIGAGISAAQGYSSWNDYVRHLIEYWKFNFKKLKSLQPYKTDWIKQLDWLEKANFTNERKVDFVRYIVEKFSGNSETYQSHVLDFEKEYFRDVNPSINQNPTLDQLARVKASYLTTNYDSQIEQSLERSLDIRPIVLHDIAEFGEQELNGSLNDSGYSTVIHLHGDTFTTPNMFISSSKSYSSLYYNNNEKNILYFKKLKRFINDKTVVFLGYGMEEDQVLAKLGLERPGVSAFALMKTNNGGFDRTIEDYFKDRHSIQIEWYGDSFDDLPRYVEMMIDRTLDYRNYNEEHLRSILLDE